MPLGDFPAGSDPAGDDPVVASSGPRTAAPPVAAMWDANSKDFLKDAAGLYRSIHPVDQKVALKLSVREGTLKSAPTLGHRLNRIKRLGPSSASQAKDAVALAVADEIKNGDIRLLSVTVDTSIPGGLFVVVSYLNLRTSKTVPLTVTP